MYSNERKSGFSILDLIVKIVFFALFVFILIYLFDKKVPNMAPFYSNVFRENIKYMQDAGEAYFTDDKMPKQVGDTVKISLSEMFDKKIVLPFVDKDGNSCNQYDSYVSVTKTVNGYELKTNLVCNTESDYLVKILGCHTYCENDNCDKMCSVEKITQYQYRKQATGTKTSYSCAKGYTLKGSKCYKTVLADSEAPKVVYGDPVTYTKPAELVVVNGKKTQLTTIVTTIPGDTYRVYLNAIKTTTDGTSERVYLTPIKSTTNGTSEKVYLTPIKTTTNGTSEKVYLTPVKTTVPATTETQKKCNTTYKQETYSCNCTTYRDSNGKSVTTCNTCTRSIPVETCKDVVVVTQEGYTKYSCPSNATGSSGSGSSLKCWYTKTTSGSTTYSCPSNATGSSGSGSSLKCWYTKTTAGTTTYSCPSNATYSSGSGSSLKCWYLDKEDDTKVYSCPSGTDAQEGSGKSLKCYKVTKGTYYYSCKAYNGYTLKGTKCYKTVESDDYTLKCAEGYKLEGKVCNKYKTETVKATAKKSTYKYYKYQWSEKTSIYGWEKTGKTKVVDGKEVCK